MQNRETLKRTILSLKAQYDRAETLSAVNRVKEACQKHNVKYDKLSLDDATFNRAIKFDQLEPFLITQNGNKKYLSKTPGNPTND